MDNKAAEGKRTGVNLEKVTVRMTSDALSVIDELAVNNGRTRSDIIRLAIDNRLATYLPNVTFVEHEDAVAFHDTLASLLTSMEDIRSELHRIGVNYNQELKLKQIAKKYAKVGDEFDFDYNAISNRRKEEKAVKSDSSDLKPEELDALLSRYEEATKKVGEALCHILE